MSSLAAALISLIVKSRRRFRGRVRLVRLLGSGCRGEYIRSKYGVLMEADLQDNTNLWAILGEYDQVASEVRKLQSGEVFIDVGANAGLFSLVASPLVGATGLVISFEPQFSMFARFVGNVRANGFENVQCFNLALSSATQVVALRGLDPHHSGVTGITERVFDSTSCETWSVAPSIDLSLVERMISGRCTTIKIDVEGHELSVLRGLIGILSLENVRKVIVEIDEANLLRAGSTPEMIYCLMREQGFDALLRIGSSHFDEIFVRAAV